MKNFLKASLRFGKFLAGLFLFFASLTTLTVGFLAVLEAPGAMFSVGVNTKFVALMLVPTGFAGCLTLANKALERTERTLRNGCCGR